MIQASFYCPQCSQQRLFQKQTANHVLHLLASLFLCGLWLPVWVIIAISENSRPFRCCVCGYGESAALLSNAEHVRAVEHNFKLKHKP